jgi:hypothetical protein
MGLVLPLARLKLGCHRQMWPGKLNEFAGNIN